jgi:hypothetical protein
MYNRKKRIHKKPIIFHYRSMNPFAEIKDDGYEALKTRLIHDAKINDENEWRIEYEMIYRSYQLER